jgi:hypothetical protein
MKYRIAILRAVALIILLGNLVACSKSISGNKRPDKYHYRNAGRHW